MKNKTFNVLLAAICAVGIISVVILLIVTYRMYLECSVISYIYNRG